MPIYPYRCEDCGFQKDALQKLSDPPLKECPACGKPALVRQLTAAGFALKGTGWYVTDFRNPAVKKPAEAAKSSEPAVGTESAPSADGKTASAKDGKAAPSADGKASPQAATAAVSPGTDKPAASAGGASPSSPPASSAGSAG